ncbi:MAG: glyoxalase [Planctomycetes bacterium]|nr:glyoxalase [Planctomycetota bacterium]
MRQLQLNHVAIHVADVEASSIFYREVLRLNEIPRPAFTFPGAWFRLGIDQELHLIGGRTIPVASHHRGTHFALRVDNLDAWESHVREIGIASHRQVRPDGALQMYVNDPDGHVIELCQI